jgi:hypothetical protein
MLPAYRSAIGDWRGAALRTRLCEPGKPRYRSAGAFGGAVWRLEAATTPRR